MPYLMALRMLEKLLENTLISSEFLSKTGFQLSSLHPQGKQFLSSIKLILLPSIFSSLGKLLIIMSELNPNELLQENIRLRKAVVQAKEEAFKQFQRQKMAYEKTIENLKRQFEKKLAEERKIQTSKQIKVLQQLEKEKEQSSEMIKSKNTKIQGLYGRVKQLEAQKQTLLSLQKQSLESLTGMPGYQNNPQRQAYRQVLKLYNNLLAQNAQLRHRVQVKHLNSSMRIEEKKKPRKK